MEICDAHQTPECRDLSSLTINICLFFASFTIYIFCGFFFGRKNFKNRTSTEITINLLSQMSWNWLHANIISNKAIVRNTDTNNSQRIAFIRLCNMTNEDHTMQSRFWNSWINTHTNTTETATIAQLSNTEEAMEIERENKQYIRGSIVCNVL